MYNKHVAHVNMRSWRNWHTRTFEGRVREGTGSSPVDRMKSVQTADMRFYLMSAVLPWFDEGNLNITIIIYMIIYHKNRTKYDKMIIIVTRIIKRNLS